MITNKKYMLQLAIICCLFGGFIIWITASPLLVIESFHYSAISFGLFQAFVFSFYIISNHLVDYFIERIGIQKLINVGLYTSLIGGILMTVFAITLSQSLYPYIGALSIFSIGTALCFAPLNRLVVESSTEPMGIRVAFFTVILMMSLALITAASGAIYNGTILSLAAPATVLSVIAYLIHRYLGVTKL